MTDPEQLSVMMPMGDPWVLRPIYAVCVGQDIYRPVGKVASNAEAEGWRYRGDFRCRRDGAVLVACGEASDA